MRGLGGVRTQCSPKCGLNFMCVTEQAVRFDAFWDKVGTIWKLVLSETKKCIHFTNS